jgi:AcrR family transcriptional regulator
MTEGEPVPLRADAERNRQRILDAAREVFAERGLDVTLDEIAHHAGVGVGTAYRRFPNKDALIEALMVERIGELETIARECLADPDPWRGLAGYFERAMALTASDRGLREVLWSRVGARKPVAVARSRIVPVVSELVQRAVDVGAVRGDMAFSDAPLINFMLGTLVDIGGDVEPELYRRYLGIVLDGLRPRRDEPSELPVEALDIDSFQRVMSKWPRR